MGTAPPPPAAAELRCEACGGAFEPAELASRVVCPFCRHAQEVDPAVLERLDDYRGKVERKVDAIAGERRQVARYDAWYGRMRRGSPATVLALTVGFMLFPTLVGLLMWGVVTLLGDAAEDLMPYVPIPLTLLFLTALAGWYAWMYSGKKRERAGGALEDTAFACPGCGAVSRIEPGERATSCDFCGASLLASEPVMGASLAGAQRAEHAARLERYRAEREGIVKVYSYTIQSYAHLMVLGPFALMTGGGAVAFSFEMIVGREPFHPGIFLIWAMFFGCVAAAVGISVYKRGKRERWRAALAAVARSSDGDLLAGIDGLAGWLDRHWAGPYDLRFLYAGPYAHGATVASGGYAGLLWLDPTAMSEHHPARGHVLLAAWIPGVTDDQGGDRTPEARALLEDLRRVHDVQLQEGGLFVALDEADLALLRRDPATVAELATLFPRLADLARALKASPVAPGA